MNSTTDFTTDEHFKSRNDRQREVRSLVLVLLAARHLNQADGGAQCQSKGRRQFGFIHGSYYGLLER